MPGRPRPTINLQSSKRIEILHRKLDSEGAAATAPAIAFDTADQSLAITGDLDKPFPATVAVQLATLLNYPRLLPQRDELSRSALHCLLVSTACAGEVRSQGNHFFYMPVGVVP